MDFFCITFEMKCCIIAKTRRVLKSFETYKKMYEDALKSANKMRVCIFHQKNIF